MHKPLNRLSKMKYPKCSMFDTSLLLTAKKPTIEKKVIGTLLTSYPVKKPDGTIEIVFREN